MIVAVEGNCSNGFSYRIEQDGDVEFLGSGTDYYEQSLEKYKKSAGLLFPKNSRHGYPPVQHKHRPTDAAHNESHCTYVLNTYPTEEFEEIYINREPLVFSIIIAGIFAMTTLVFLSYDILVEQRQRRLVRRAKNTDAIVSSIFVSSYKRWGRHGLLFLSHKPFQSCHVLAEKGSRALAS